MIEPARASQPKQARNLTFHHINPRKNFLNNNQKKEEEEELPHLPCKTLEHFQETANAKEQQVKGNKPTTIACGTNYKLTLYQVLHYI